MFDMSGNHLFEVVRSVSSDVLLVGGCVMLCIAFGLTKGKDVLLAILIALYPAIVVATEYPFYGRLGGSMGGVVEPLAVFMVTWVAVFFIIRNYIHSMYPMSGFWRLLEIIVLSLSVVGLCVASLYHVVDIERVYDFTAVIDVLVASQYAWMLWLTAPLVSIPLFVRA